MSSLHMTFDLLSILVPVQMRLGMGVLERRLSFQSKHTVIVMADERPAIFECLKLFQVEESTPTAGGEKPIQSFGTCFNETT